MPLDSGDLQRIMALIDERVEPVRLQRIEFEELKAAIRALQVEIAHLSAQVAELVAAQKRTDEQIAELAQAQRRTDKQVAELAERMERGFAEARAEMAEMRSQMAEMRSQMAEMRSQMAEQGERMERGFAEMRGEMAEMRSQMAESRALMAEQGERMERGFKEFRTAITDLRKEVGALGEAYGLDLEDVARYVVPLYLREVAGYEVGELATAYLPVDGEEFEVDLHGTARKGGQAFTVVGEAKSRVQPHEMEELVGRNARLEAARPGPYLWVLFPRRIHPRALELARRRGVILVPWDYQYSRRPS